MTAVPGIHIKRIIGLPEETILIDEGQVVIDGEPYTEENMPAIENREWRRRR